MFITHHICMSLELFVLQKAVAKMNIQRILMDARFGLGACARMIHDDELTEVAAVSTASHDVVTSQQHVDETSRRMT